MKSFKSYQHQRILLPDNTIANGKYTIDGDFTVIIKDGFLNDEVSEDGTLIPAISTSDASHIEHWRNGVLHCETEPAIIDNIDNYEEWWLNGKQVRGTVAEANTEEEELVINFQFKNDKAPKSSEILSNLQWKDTKSGGFKNFLK